MTFTKTLPTRPGAYWWRSHDKADPIAALVMDASTAYPALGGLYVEFSNASMGHVTRVGGEWCELVPKDEVVPKGEVLKVWDEARERCRCRTSRDGWKFVNYWNDSRAKRVMEGKE